MKKQSLIGIPSWLILGTVMILGPIFFLLTLESINRQKGNTQNLLLEKGAALIRSFEAGTRTGMMGMKWGDAQIQRLLSETAVQPDIIYIMITNETGTILAHNEPARIGGTYGKGLDLHEISQSKQMEWRQVSTSDNEKIFEVYRQFAPIRGNFQGRRGHGRHMKNNDRRWFIFNFDDAQKDKGLAIFVGLDMAPLEKVENENIRHTLILGSVLMLVGLAGILSLFLAHAYRAAKSSLSKIRAFSDNLVANMPIGLVAVDPHGKIVSFNQTSENLLQISTNEVLGQNSSAILPPQFLKIVSELQKQTGIIHKEIECPVADDRTIPMEVIATTLQEKDGSFLGHVVLFRDLTEIQELKMEVARKERLASIGSLAAGVAHEIRNPLSSIKGFATYFQERYSDVPEDQKTAGIMIQEVERLNRVISRLLDLARPSGLQKKRASIPDLINHTIEMVKEDAAKKNIEIKTEMAGSLKSAAIDPDQIKQVLLNLYLNAIEAMDKGGILSVALNADKNAGMIRISVSDTGIGIKKEDQARIFDPYFTTKQTGTGLGLAIVHKIIESHGGHIKVESRYTEGTEVTVTLPAITSVCPEM